jgi:hypothetical protein
MKTDLSMKQEITIAFEKGSDFSILKLIDSHLGMHSYSPVHLFKDVQREVLNRILSETME